jgi:hypothetical protein
MTMLESFDLIKEFTAVGPYATGFPVRAEGGFIYAICWVNNGQHVPFYAIQGEVAVARELTLRQVFQAQGERSVDPSIAKFTRVSVPEL